MEVENFRYVVVSSEGRQFLSDSTMNTIALFCHLPANDNVSCLFFSHVIVCLKILHSWLVVTNCIDEENNVP